MDTTFMSIILNLFDVILHQVNYGYNIHGGLLFDKDFIEQGLSQEKVIWLENGYH